MKKKAVTKKRVSKPKAAYEASIKILGAIYTACGTTPMEAIANLQPVGMPRSVSVLTVSKDGVSRSKILGAHLTPRLFAPSPLMRQIATKQVSFFFDGL